MDGIHAEEAKESCPGTRSLSHPQKGSAGDWEGDTRLNPFSCSLYSCLFSRGWCISYFFFCNDSSFHQQRLVEKYMSKVCSMLMLPDISQVPNLEQWLRQAALEQKVPLWLNHRLPNNYSNTSWGYHGYDTY